jgi:hypothetical protein
LIRELQHWPDDMKNPHPLIVQRASKKRRDQEDREEELLRAIDHDPRRDNRESGRYDQTWIKPLIDEE